MSALVSPTVKCSACGTQCPAHPDGPHIEVVCSTACFDALELRRGIRVEDERLDAVLRAVAAGDPLLCDGCEKELLPGDAITFDRSMYCYVCAGDRALLAMEAALFPGFEPREARRVQRAIEILRMVMARAELRVREIARSLRGRHEM